jgi:small-conductance mechanosensitive channel
LSIRIVVLALLAFTATHLVHAATSEAPAKAPSAEATKPLTRDEVRELVARLSDAEVRKLLIDQLDRGTAAPAKAAPPSGMLGTMATGLTQLRTRGAEIAAAALSLPAATAALFGKLVEGINPLVMLLLLAAMFAAGALAEYLWTMATRAWRARHAGMSGEGFFADSFHRGMPLVIDLAGLAVFAGAAMAVFFSVWHGNALRHSFALGLLAAFLVVRAVQLIARFVLAPSNPGERLLPLPDDAARTLALYATFVAALSAFGLMAADIYRDAGTNTATVDAIMLILVHVGLFVTLYLIWRIREPIATLIRDAAGGGGLARLIADLWPIAATVFLLVIHFARVHEIVTGVRGSVSGAGALSILMLAALPIVDYALCRALAAAAATSRGRDTGGKPGFIASYEPVLRRVIHIVVAVTGFLWIAGLWEINLFAMAQESLGGRVAGSLVGIGLVLLLAFLAWDVARTAIDRRLAAEQNVPDNHPTSRLRTLLPLLRVTLMITIGVMATLSVLAALGVDILPLLAGAGVVGVAIGFGSQTLVRDVVSGAFFLMDDAFRIGEYIEVGDAKGRIEKITVRALFLRHHRGAINILPYGEIKRLRNNSRDWTVMVMPFRLALDTDLMKVKKIVKKVGEEIAANPELGPAFIEPLKSQGIMETDENALIVRAKFMARPGDAVFMIRRQAYEKILKAFHEQGVEFASRRVAVDVGNEVDETQRKRLAAAAVAQELATKPAA